MRCRFFLLLLFAPLAAIEMQPWFSDFLQPEINLAYRYGSHPLSPAAVNHSNTIQAGWMSVGISPWPAVHTQIEGAVAYSHFQRSFFFEYGRFTARYLFRDQLGGDWANVTGGFSVTPSSRSARRNVGLPYLGSVDYELHAAVGRELLANRCTWCLRAWAAGAAAWSRHWTPQLRGLAFLEGNLRDCHRGWVGLRGLFGTRGKKLITSENFDGWSPYQTRAAEVEVGYSYSLGIYGRLWTDCRYRFYADNYPRRQLIARLGLLYYFAL